MLWDPSPAGKQGNVGMSQVNRRREQGTPQEPPCLISRWVGHFYHVLLVQLFPASSNPAVQHRRVLALQGKGS